MSLLLGRGDPQERAPPKKPSVRQLSSDPGEERAQLLALCTPPQVPGVLAQGV